MLASGFTTFSSLVFCNCFPSPLMRRVALRLDNIQWRPLNLSGADRGHALPFAFWDRCVARTDEGRSGSCTWELTSYDLARGAQENGSLRTIFHKRVAATRFHKRRCDALPLKRGQRLSVTTKRNRLSVGLSVTHPPIRSSRSITPATQPSNHPLIHSSHLPWTGAGSGGTYELRVTIYDFEIALQFHYALGAG